MEKKIEIFVDKIHNQTLKDNKFTLSNDYQYFLQSKEIWIDCLKSYNSFLKKNLCDLDISCINILQCKNKKRFVTGTLHDTKYNNVLRIRNSHAIEREVLICNLLKHEPSYYNILDSNEHYFLTKYIEGKNLSDFLLNVERSIDIFCYFITEILLQSQYIFKKYNIVYLSNISNVIITEKNSCKFIDLENARLLTSDDKNNFKYFIRYYHFFKQVHFLCIKNNLAIKDVFEKIKKVLPDLIIH